MRPFCVLFLSKQKYSHPCFFLPYYRSYALLLCPIATIRAAMGHTHPPKRRKPKPSASYLFSLHSENCDRNPYLSCQCSQNGARVAEQIRRHAHYFPNFIVQQHPTPRIVSKPLFRSGKLPISYLASYQQAPCIPSLTFFCSISSNLQTCPSYHGPQILSQICGPYVVYPPVYPTACLSAHLHHSGTLILCYLSIRNVFISSVFRFSVVIVCSLVVFMSFFVLVDLEHLLRNHQPALSDIHYQQEQQHLYTNRSQVDAAQLISLRQSMWYATLYRSSYCTVDAVDAHR